MTLTERIETRIIELQQERDLIDAEIRGLQIVLEEHDGERGNEDRPPSGPARNGAPPAGSGRAPAADDRRLEIARLLAAGSMRVTEIAEKTESEPHTVGRLLKHPWFAKAGPNLRDPFTLTAEGRTALKADGG
jgi:DNA invertase Pin-like site-specific DNA recombinase